MIEGRKFKYSLMLAMMATGISGIVAEYLLATVATYVLGDSVFQWTIIVSLMLFAMGLGSRLSRLVKGNELKAFVAVEMVLSLLTAGSVSLVYALMPYVFDLAPVIYLLSFLVGLLIGMEIPLVARINSRFEGIRTNVSSVLEKDYYGSLIGGGFFAFVGVPYIGLQYMPFVVGALNLLVALYVLWVWRHELSRTGSRMLGAASAAILISFSVLIVHAKEIVMHGNQVLYTGRLVYSEQTPYQQIALTEWQNEYTLYLNKGKQLCTLDEWMYHEPLVHPPMWLCGNPRDVLVLGAGDGCAVRELLKHPQVSSITVVDIDPAVVRMAKRHPVLRRLNQGAFSSDKVETVHQDAFRFLQENQAFYDVIIADFPDPRTIELSRLYSYEFYSLVHQRLRDHGVFITQATSPYYTPGVFRTIEYTLSEAGFQTLPIHNHVFTFGEWGWVIGSKNRTPHGMKDALRRMELPRMELRFLKGDALNLITSFGGELQEVSDEEILVNSIDNPVLHRIYDESLWLQQL